jgi:hypothetical protein
MAGTPLPLAQVEDFAKVHRCQPVSGFVTDEESSRAAPEYNDGPTKYGNANCTMVGPTHVVGFYFLGVTSNC